VSLARRSVEVGAVAAALALTAWALLADAGWYERHVVPARCLTGSTAGWQIVRAFALAVAAALAFWVRPRLGRAVAGTAGRDLAATAGGIAIALVAALGAGEIILRRVQWDDVIANPDVVKTVSDPRLGWRIVPSQTLDYTAGGIAYKMAIGADGTRVAAPGAAIDWTAPTFVVSGESIAMGQGLDWADTFGAQIGKALGLQVVNLGAPAYGNDQADLRLGEVLDRLSQPKVVLVVFAPIQLRRNISPARPRLTLEGGQLVATPAATGFAAWRLARLLRDEPYHDDEALAVTRTVLLATEKTIRAHGAEPLFLITNYGPPCADPNPPSLERLFAGLPKVRVDIRGEDALGPEDPHPNPGAARRIAAEVLKALSSPSRPPRNSGSR